MYWIIGGNNNTDERNKITSKWGNILCKCTALEDPILLGYQCFLTWSIDSIQSQSKSQQIIL